MPVVALLPYFRPGLALWLWPLACYLALSAGVIAHNHNHTPTFRPRIGNSVFGNWLSIFYGYPTYAWVPTHNLNHHRLVNKAGDATITWRHTNAHNALVAGTYFFVSSWYQSEPIKDYIRKAKEKNPRLYRTIIGQYVFFLGTHAALLALAIALHGFRLGFKVWGLMFLVPALFALWTIMLFNYIQHVHADPWSEHNHSRSFTSPLLNFLLFNNGPRRTRWPVRTGARCPPPPGGEDRPALLESSFWWFCLRNYLLAPLRPRARDPADRSRPFDTRAGHAGRSPPRSMRSGGRELPPPAPEPLEADPPGPRRLPGRGQGLGRSIQRRRATPGRAGSP
jgi:hypothetical protein